MSVSAIVNENGEIVNNSDPKKAKGIQDSTGTSIKDYKDQFMQLLVAQMKYQDPLEPTSNTEYISQYAQFTQVEQMQNMADAMALSRAADLVGKTVQITKVDDEGNSRIVAEGKVDYVTYQHGDAYVTVNGVSYNADQVSSVIDSTYSNDTKSLMEIQEILAKLPPVEEITLAANEKDLEKLVNKYNSLSDIEKYLTDAQIAKIKDYATKYAALVVEETASNAAKERERQNENAVSQNTGTQANTEETSQSQETQNQGTNVNAVEQAQDNTDNNSAADTNEEQAQEATGSTQAPQGS
ncbi:flagellar hook capping FlgD N-terminal domain-containing protein [Butyrivibrio sp. NC3005]|uniref:flagellar hook capping FlgD N-terminal domain-containing protein n=1 Tax=Butyrivibrio sp. NC3005 TaxID=1280685 RepID=UPI00041CA839|nr:flagellar hook capping FlgD N-terminal domain-containing protein [Butyrivibrio sp. NC3005]